MSAEFLFCPKLESTGPFADNSMGIKYNVYSGYNGILIVVVDAEKRNNVLRNSE